MFCTALSTPFPKYTPLSPSLSSTASCLPVDAPEGTEALPVTSFSVSTSASTVGFPLESKICRACIFTILPINLVLITINLLHKFIKQISRIMWSW